MHRLRFLTYIIPLFLFAQTTVSIFAQGNDNKDNTKGHPANAHDILTGNTPEEKIYTLRKQEFIDNAAESYRDTSFANISFTFNSDKHLPLYLDSDGLKGLSPFKDDIQEGMQRDAGIPSTISLTAAIEALVKSYQKNKKGKKVKNLSVPTDMEIDVLKILWVEETATASEIYAKLDSNTTIHSEELQNVLSQMTTKGFLDRKKISPSNEFNLFGFAQIELSSKNRKNKVYLYWPIITKKKLFTYLDAEHYLALVESQHKNDIDLKNNDFKSNYQIFLEKKLYRLFE